MFLSYAVLLVCACLCFVKSQSTASSEDEETTIALEPEDDEDVIQQWVALIDIVFTDGKKRTCTGAIIHDYVVITAGHCFIGGIELLTNIPPELTASFVVIGTKNKFEAGYEQYLPIERVITHPNMQGWKSDLSLIHTFASMTANKIGAVIPLANDRSYGPGDGNFTILSWGRIMGGQEEEESTKEESNSCEIDYGNNDESSESNKPRYLSHDRKQKARDFKDSTMPVPIEREGKGMPSNPNLLRQQPEPNHPTSKKVSRYLSSNEHKNHQKQDVSPPRHRYHKMHRNLTVVNKDTNVKESKTGVNFKMQQQVPELLTKVNKTEINKRTRILKRGRKQSRKHKSIFATSWRRQMGNKEANKLTVESFGFVGSQPCKKMVNKIVPQMHLNSSEIVCYASDDHYVTDEDSGAPAIRHRELVAITVGGIVSEGDHVAIGIKLSEYCAWISENLPAGTETSLNCWSHSHGNDMHEYDETEKDEKKLDKIKGNKNRYLGRTTSNGHIYNGTKGLNNSEAHSTVTLSDLHKSSKGQLAHGGLKGTPANGHPTVSYGSSTNSHSTSFGQGDETETSHFHPSVGHSRPNRPHDHLSLIHENIDILDKYGLLSPHGRADKLDKLLLFGSGQNNNHPTAIHSPSVSSNHLSSTHGRPVKVTNRPMLIYGGFLYGVYVTEMNNN